MSENVTKTGQPPDPGGRNPDSPVVIPQESKPQQIVDELRKIPKDDIEEVVAILEDRHIDKSEWGRLVGIGIRNWKTISAVIGILVTGVGVTYGVMRGGTEPTPAPVPPDGAAEIVKAIERLTVSQEASFKKLEVKIDAAIVVPVPIPPPKPPIPTPSVPIILDELITAPVGQMTKVPVKAVGTVTWWVQPPHEKEVDYDNNFLRITPAADSTFWIIATCANDGKSALRAVEVRAGKGPQPPPIPPDPKPPTPPDPPKPPEPKDEPVLGDGFRVLIIRETGKPTKHDNSIYSEETFNYLKAKTVPTKDGAKRGWYVVDKDVNFGADSKVWSNAINRKGATIPWLIVSAPGRGSYEGPYPDNHAVAMKLFKKYGD